MDIAVCAKVTPDTDTRIKVKGDGSGIETAGIKWIVSPYDAFAVEEATKLKEAKKAGAVKLFSVGGDDAVAALRLGGLAVGADDLTLVNDEAVTGSDSLATARALAAAITDAGDIGLVFTGKQAADDDNVQVPAMLAEILGWAHISFVSGFELDGDTFKATRNVGGGVQEVVYGSLPVVITCDKGMNTPRYAKLPQVMKAKRKKVHKKAAADIGLDGDAVAAKVTVSAYGAPPPRPAGRILEGDLGAQLDELVGLLRNEVKVL